ncbi:alpha/beta fold hydrolase [Paenibacillus sp. M1]|uniref:Alpha/beta fold hydrolase n=1 Tax=Paenibacillus haidiansis TaxID=1574488 RepID=A0ABU7VPR7_9BACL
MIYQTNAISQAKPRRLKRRKVLSWTLAVVVVLVLGLAVLYKTLTYEPLDAAVSALSSDENVTVNKTGDGYVLEPAGMEALQPNIIFYPGGLVEPESYALFGRKLAEAGHRVYIAAMPLNLAMLGQNKADSFIAEHPEDSYVIGGHSLGGVFASRYAAKHPDSVAGVYFLASYADDGGSLNGLNMSALQITGSNDGVLDREAWERAKSNLPDATTYVTIEGGNHGQFGVYGMQKGDNAASISAEEQLLAVAGAMEEWMGSLGDPNDPGTAEDEANAESASNE